MQKNKKVFFLDIDGTLIPSQIGPQTGQPSLKDQQAIARAQREGHKVFFCTGRGYGFIPKSVTDVIRPDGAVAGGGVYVCWGERMLHRRYLSDEQVRLILQLAQGQQARCFLEGEKRVFVLNGLAGDGAEKLADVDSFPWQDADNTVSKATLFDDPAKAVYDVLRRDFDFYPHPDYFDICLKGENKSNGMRIVLEALGAVREQSVAIGDSENDLDGIVFAGCGVAMGNACRRLKDAADWVTLGLEDSGAGYAIEKIISEKE